MPDPTKFLREYTRSISANLARGDATEHTHRPALKSLVESLFPDAIATNEPRRIQAGAPDYIISLGSVNIGYVEAKDVGKNLREIEKDEQLKRYRASLPNLILTDYVEFRWYTDGQLRQTATLGMVTDDAVKPSKESLLQVHDLLDHFMQHRVPSAVTPKELAGRMAHLARMIRDIAAKTFEAEEITGTLHGQYEAFKEVLLPDLTVEQFADMFAQTVAYGLFAARENSGKSFTRQNAVYSLPKTNPFLRKLFGHIAGAELDDRIAWIVDDLAQVLQDADMGEILRDFSTRTRKEDPVVHFYETFLREYNPKERKLRGVYYTPEPVVSYIVRSVDYLLQTKFDKPLGLADPSVLILDPACGTGTFLFYVVKLIHDRLVEQGQAGGWNDYVEKHLLPRLFGFELLMAPYTVAHLKMGMLLEELGYEFKSDQRLGIYLTNTLEPGVKSDQVLGFAGFITEEANAAADIKQEKPIMVVIGNPPYSGHSANKGKWIDALLKGKSPDGAKMPNYYEVDGQPLGERNPKWLQDDYVKFIRFGQWRIDETGYGILAFVTNHGYLDNPTFRGMRQSLMQTFSEISVLDLHGNAKKKETTPEGGKDENVFDIQQGVAIGLFAKEKGKAAAAKVQHADLFGLRMQKYSALNDFDASSTDWQGLQPSSPFYLLISQETKLRDEYETGWRVPDLYRVYASTVTTARNDFAMSFEPEELIRRIRDLQDQEIDDQTIRARYGLKDVSYWRLGDARLELLNVTRISDHIKHYCYRPLDFRFVFYHSAICERLREEVMAHMRPDNMAFLTHRPQSPGDFTFAYCTRMIGDQCVAANKTAGGGNSFQFPLYLYPTPEEKKKQKDLHLDQEYWPLSDKGRRPNLNPDFVADMTKRLGMEFVTDGKGDLEKTFGPEDIFHYIYAVFHSPTYRTRYAEFLKIDFPRVPLTSDKELFRRLVEKGAELVSLHLMESPALNNLVTKCDIPGTDVVEKVTYFDTLKRVSINKVQYFEGIEPEVWEFHIGGYQVLDKWLKDRKGRKLTWEDQQHYQKIVVALRETMRIMQEIDEVIESHGGWPLGVQN